MKIAENYLLKEIAGNYVVIPTGQNIIDYKRMLHLNETGAFIWKLLENDISYEDIMDALIKEYEASDDDRSIIQSDLNEYLDHMRKLNLIIN